MSMNPFGEIAVLGALPRTSTRGRLMVGSGDISGALGPVAPAAAGEFYEMKISGFGPVNVKFF
jgi:hypothetical protein